MWKKAVLLGMAGFILGALICMAFMLSAPPFDFPAALPHLLLAGIYGAVAMASSLIYSIEKWSIARTTVTHFLLIFSLYCALGFSLDWFRPGDTTFWIIMAVMAAAYFLIWLSQYLSYKRRVRQMNDDLKKLKSSQRTE